MAQAEQLFDQTGIALAALGMGKVEELPNREVARMCRHEVEEPGFHFGVAEVAEIGELVFSGVHGFKSPG